MIKTTDIREREDLSNVIDTLLLKDKDMRLLSFVNFLRNTLKVTAQKHEWLDDSARAQSISVQASGDGADWDTDDDITALPCAAAECAKLRVGDLLLLDTDEVVRVADIDSTGETIDLTARGHGSTTAAVLAHDSAHTCYIIGNASEEDTDPVDANFSALSAVYNYTQIFDDVAEVSGTIRRSRTVSGDEHDRQVVKKIKEQLRSLNYAIAEGIKDLTSNVGTMGGLREFLTTTYNINGALTLEKLYAIAEAIMSAGGTPTQIHASVGSISAIEQLFVGNVRYESSDRRAGLSVAKVSMLGLDMELYADRHVRDAEILMLDGERVSYGPLAGGKYEDGKFSAYPLYDKRNGKRWATEVLGEYTLEVLNAAGAGCRGYGRT